MKKLLLVFIVLSIPAAAWSQEPVLPEREKRIAPRMDVAVGFPPYGLKEVTGRYKVGLWTPVYVTVDAGTEGVPCDELVVETVDSEDVPTMFRVAVTPLDKKEKRTFLAYTKQGNLNGEIKVTLQAKGRTLLQPSPTSHGGRELGTHLYLTIGKKLPALQEALVDMARKLNQGRGFDPEFADTSPRYAAYELNADRLPDSWLGYNAVDLMILTTGDPVTRPILEKLLTERDGTRLRAIAQWVRRGGRLVISVHWNSQELVSRLLQAPAWQPPLPVTIPALQQDIEANKVKRLLKVENWAGINDAPFDKITGIPISLLGDQNPNRDWDVVAQTNDGRPLIAHMSYGLGQITLLAFALDDNDFRDWSGNKRFFEAMFNKLGPRVVGGAEMHQGKFIGRRGDGMEELDLTSQLQRAQDNFDVTVVPFGWVALFIIIYIVVVGPLDYIILKKVFKHLEWTWITFPTVVLTISALAYFTAYALKGNDLKINKIDIVDMDMRTHLDAKQRTVKAYAYGQSFFTILSPRIQNYTVGLEPAVPWWWGERKPEDELYSADAVSWLGRPDYSAMGMGGRSTGLFRRPYDFALDTTGATRVIGLRGVPIPVWTTKAFTASWEAPLPQLPLKADLVYHQDARKDLRLSGALQNLMPADLDDVWIFYRGRVYSLKQPLGGRKSGGKEQKIALEKFDALQQFKDWAGQVPLHFQPDFPFPGDRPANITYEPTTIVKQLLFHEKREDNSIRNHALRPIDQSWRLAQDDTEKGGDTRMREAILYGRFKRQMGPAETLCHNADQPLPTFLWLDDVPGKEDDGKTNKTRPSLVGTMTQDTYIRIIIPVRPAGN